MIAPVALSDLLAADPLGAMKSAIRDRLAALLPGLAVVSHPGRIDISEVVGKSVVATPGVAVGWSRIRALRIVDGGHQLAVEWTAYVVVEDAAIAGRRVEREALGLAIGSRLVAILEDPDSHTWGCGNVLPPEADPRPELRPMFTVRDVTAGAAYYAVTWTQTLVDQGASLFAADRPTITAAEDEPAIDFDFGDGGLPPEVAAILAGLEDDNG
jgi:hypothetical protein